MSETIPQWEYHVAEFGGILKREPKPAEMEEYLNGLGAEGWELVGVVYLENYTRWRLFAKRPLTSAARRRRSMPE